MNKKSLFLGMAAFAIAALVFVGCDNGAQEVEGSVGINNNKAPEVSAVTVTKTDNGHVLYRFLGCSCGQGVLWGVDQARWEKNHYIGRKWAKRQ